MKQNSLIQGKLIPGKLIPGKLIQGALILGTCILIGNVWASSPAPDGASAYIISPKNGETVTSPVTIKFGLKGMGVAPAGIDKANTGHHHLLIDLDTLPAMDSPVPGDDQHRHFGSGQTETELKLSPGQHTLQLLLGDKNHIPHSTPVLSEKITITVMQD